MEERNNWKNNKWIKFMIYFAIISVFIQGVGFMFLGLSFIERNGFNLTYFLMLLGGVIELSISSAVYSVIELWEKMNDIEKKMDKSFDYIIKELKKEEKK